MRGPFETLPVGWFFPLSLLGSLLLLAEPLLLFKLPKVELFTHVSSKWLLQSPGCQEHSFGCQHFVINLIMAQGFKVKASKPVKAQVRKNKPQKKKLVSHHDLAQRKLSAHINVQLEQQSAAKVLHSKQQLKVVSSHSKDIKK